MRNHFPRIPIISPLDKQFRSSSDKYGMNSVHDKSSFSSSTWAQEESPSLSRDMSGYEPGNHSFTIIGERDLVE